MIELIEIDVLHRATFRMQMYVYAAVKKQKTVYCFIKSWIVYMIVEMRPALSKFYIS